MTLVTQSPPVESPLLGSVPEVLAWRTTAGTVDHIIEGHASLLGEAFRQMLGGPPASKAGDQLQDLVRSLPEEVITRLVSAPESCRRLRYGKDPGAEFFVESALAERQRSGAGDPIVDEGVWSALGDCWFPTHPGSVEAVFQAPVLSNGVVVDLVSPRGARLLRAYGRTLPSAGSVDVQTVVAKLEDALAVMGAVSPATARFFSSFVQVVIPWEDPRSPRGRASLSDTRWVGAVACANVTAVHELHLVDMLIHESVHSLLGMVEEYEPMISDLDAVGAVRVASPWTGTPLHPRNFLHASFVWFALRQFWRTASGRGIAEETRVDRLLNQAGSGFHSPVLWESLSEVAAHLSPPAAQTIPAFFDAVTTGAYD